MQIMKHFDAPTHNLLDAIERHSDKLPLSKRNHRAEGALIDQFQST